MATTAERINNKEERRKNKNRCRWRDGLCGLRRVWVVPPLNTPQPPSFPSREFSRGDFAAVGAIIDRPFCLMQISAGDHWSPLQSTRREADFITK